MKTYQLVFKAKHRGAIGVSSIFSRIVEAESPQAAILKLYDWYDHIQMMVVSEIKR